MQSENNNIVNDLILQAFKPSSHQAITPSRLNAFMPLYLRVIINHFPDNPD